MKYIDADGHVEESPITFSDQYFAPAFRAQRPQVVPGTEDGLAYWMIDEQLFPKLIKPAIIPISGPTLMSTAHKPKP